MKTIDIPTKSIMWGTDPTTGQNFMHRMRTLIKFWKVENGQKTELLTARFSENGGVHGDNNHPSGSSINVPFGRYCYEVYNISTNQVPINQTVIRGDSTNTNTIWGCAKDINGNACYNKIESGEKKEIYFDVENYEGANNYHLNCNAWFVTQGFEQRFTPNPTDTITDYSINPLRIGRPIFTEEGGNMTKENFITFRNYLTGKSFDLPNTQYFEGTQTINPFYEPDNNVNTQNPIYKNGGSIPTPKRQEPTNNRNKIIVGSIALLTILSFRKNANTARNDNR